MALNFNEIAQLSDPDLRRKLTEEAAEVIKEASDLIKALMKYERFGPRPFAGGVQYDNATDAIDAGERLRIEFVEVNCLMLEFRNRHGRN